jgi:Carboxypeptidase regulatory-like domain/TonB-dependent Receptor Plug Domain
MKGILRVRLLFGELLILSSAIALAQDTASLTGTIRDATGAVVAGAGVVIKNTANGLTRELKTNSDGEYLAGALPAGHYDIFVAAKGFRKYRADDVTLRVAQSARIDVKLQVGDAHEEVTVRGEGLAQVETQSSELGGTITGKEITQLQLNGRNFTQLVTLVPGVSNQTGQDEGVVGAQGNVNYSINGGRVENNNWEIDGGDTMDNGSNDTLNVYPSIDSLAEVRVLTSNYGAQYGRNASGTIEAETKSGTNGFHGDVYEFFRNEALNAHNYFDQPGVPKPEYRKNDFGYTLGGPIWKNHTFFFWSQEWRRENVPTNFYNFVPSLENRQGNFADVCSVPNPTDCPVDQNGNEFPNDQLPFIDPSAPSLLGMIPEPTAGSGADSLFIASAPQPMHWREELLRVDHDITPRERATFRYIHDSWDIVNSTVTWAGESFPTIGTHFIGPGISMVAKLTSTITPTLLNEFVASYTTDHIQQINTNPQVWTRTKDFTMPGLFPNNNGELPDICLSTSGAYGGGFCEGPSAFPWNNSNPTYTLRDNITKSWGKHNLQFGGYYVTAQKNERAYTDMEGDMGFDSTSPVTTGNAFADLLMGNVAYYSQDSAEPKYHIHYRMFEPYIQDDYRVSKNLTLNLGLRLSFFGTFYEQQQMVYNWEPSAFDPKQIPKIDVTGNVTGQEGALIPGTGNPFNGMVQCGAPGIPRGCELGKVFNPAPRVGFAWDPFGKGTTAIRGGYGIFFDHTNGEEANAENLEGTPPLVQEPTQFNVNGYNNVGGLGLLFPLSTISIPTQVIWPYVQQWHLDIQRELPKNTVATISYVGSKGTHLTLIHELNQLAPVPASENPFQPGQPITDDICNSQAGSVKMPRFKVNGQTVTGQPAINLAVACGNDPNPYRPYQGLDSTEGVSPEANSNYNALQFSLRRTSGALTLSVAYTYSHSLDNSSDKFDSNFVNSYNVKGSYASSNFDQRHILTVAWVYDLPFFRSPGLSHSLLGGWQYAGIMTAQSGEPFSVLNGVYGDSAGVANGVGTGSYADLVGDPHAVSGHQFSSDPVVKGPMLFNTNAYVETQGLTFGNSGRNSLNIPFRTNFDMSMYKVFKPTEKLDVQFRVEAFNIFNHTQWTGVNNYIGTDYFLFPSGAHTGRVLQLGLKVVF